MKVLLRIIFPLSIMIVILMIYTLFFSSESFFKAISEPGYTLGEIIFILYYFGLIFHFITAIYCIYHMFKSKKSIIVKLIFIILFLFLPLISNFIYFEKYIFE